MWPRKERTIDILRIRVGGDQQHKKKYPKYNPWK
jgi:hypothetical protein